jgi:hypothetical protein
MMIALVADIGLVEWSLLILLKKGFGFDSLVPGGKILGRKLTRDKRLIR